MSIEKIWGEINDGGDDDLAYLLQKPGISKFQSHTPLLKIKRRLLLNITWGSIVCVIYALIIIFFDIWQVQIAIGVTLIFSAWAVQQAYLQYKKISTTISSADSLLSELKRHHQSIRNWLSIQQRVAIIIYPVSAAGGFMLGGVVGSGKSVDLFMRKPASIIGLLICIAILVPACYYLAKWMCKNSFGKQLNALQKNIDELEGL